MMKDLKKNYITHDQEHVASVVLYANWDEIDEGYTVWMYADEACTERVSCETLFDLAMKQLVVVALRKGENPMAYYTVVDFGMEGSSTAYVTINDRGTSTIIRAGGVE